MNILNIYVLQSILGTSERKKFQIYGAVQIKIILKTCNKMFDVSCHNLHNVVCLLTVIIYVL